MEAENTFRPSVSYLKARDPSILAFNLPQPEIKQNLAEEFNEITQQEEDERIRVYLRIKSGFDFKNIYNINGNILTSIVPPGSNFLRNAREGDSMKKTYTFTKIFQPDTTQSDIFNYIIKPKLLDFINGQNSTLLTYGASGSGKTFTVIGTANEPGVLPRSLEYLFRTLPQLTKNPIAKPSQTGEVMKINQSDGKKEKQFCKSLLNSSSSLMDKHKHLKTYMAMQQRLSTEPVAEIDDEFGVVISVWISFAEIYNEQIYDLLKTETSKNKQRPRLRLGMSNGQTYIKDLTNICVTSGQEAYQILQYGLHNLNFASTPLNDHSSRSHSIFTIKLVQVNESDGGSCISCFNFCDLAGSERVKKTHHAGERLKESNNINTSLLVLGRCISAVRSMQKPHDHKLVPFRESKLTQLFQRALGGIEDIAMIITISPSRDSFDESQHVLNFSAIAKDIIIERKVEPVIKKKNRFSTLVEESHSFGEFSEEDYQRAITLLREELETLRNEHQLDQEMNFNYVRDEYEKLLSTIQNDNEKIIQKRENAVRAYYENRIENMKFKYERIIEQLEQRNNVIEIDSDDDGENGSLNRTLEKTLKEGVQEYKELEAKYLALEQENACLRAKCTELENELELVKNVFIQRDNCSSESEENNEDCTI